MTAPYGSMGDQALALGTQAGLEMNGEEGCFLFPGDPVPWQTLGIRSAESIDRLMVPKAMWPTGRARQRYRSHEVTVIGADTIGGDYEHRFLAHRVAALNESASAGQTARLVNFSLNERPTPLAQQLLSRLDPRVELWARDLASQERAERLLRRNVNVAPDVGFLLPQGERTSDAAPYKAVIVPNAHFITHLGASREEIVDYWSDIAIELRQRGDVALLPHDQRSSPGDIALATEVVSRVQQIYSSGVDLVTVDDARAAKRVIGEADLLISARMHACIAGLSLGIPTVGIDYLEKFKGQFAWYGALGRVVSFEDALNLSAMRKQIGELVDVRRIPAVGPNSADIQWLLPNGISNG